MSSSQTLARPDQIKDVIKRLLKEKGFTYGDVASALNCSLPTIKRVLGPEELTLSRLLEICELLDLRLSDLEELIRKNQSSDRVEFTEEQEEFFAKNPAYLTYLFHLYGGRQPEELAKEYGLTKRSTDLYLLRLERLDLIRIDSKGRIKRCHQETPIFNKKGGVLARQHLKSAIDRVSGIIGRQVLKSLAKEQDDKRGTGVHMMSYTIPTELYTRWVEKLGELMKEFDSQGTFEDRHRPSPTNPTALVSIMYTLLEPRSDEVRNLKTTFADIKNL